MVEKSNPKVKTCYYELLEVDSTATQKDIERGYKRAALKWHPDKNKDTDTTQKFQDISAAYTVLSDPNERQWYDDHKD
jgi:DnaJ homolog subfamily A member 5